MFTNDSISFSEVPALQELTNRLIEGDAAIRELELLKPILALVIHKYAEGEVAITLTEQAQLGEVLALQVRADENGAVHLRSVEL